MSYDENDFHYQVEYVANLLASSVSELARCSSDTLFEVEMSVARALREARPDQVKAIYDSLNCAFEEVPA